MRMLRIILMIGVIIITIGNLTGCGKSEKQLKEILATALEEKYEEEFVCLDVWGNGGDSYYGVCYPKGNNKLLFETIFYSNGNLLRDGYAARMVSDEFSEKLDNLMDKDFKNYFIYCYNNGNMYDDMTSQKIKNDEFTLDYYFEEHNKKYDDNKMTLNYTICFDTSAKNQLSYEEEYDMILKALDEIKEIGNSYGVELYFRMNLYFVPVDIYDKCIDYFKENAIIRSSLQDMVEGYPERKHRRLIKFDVGIDIYKLTKDEYVELRKELN